MFQPSDSMLLVIALLAIIILLILIIKFKLHSFIALVLVSLLTALASGIELSKVVPTLLSGFGNTLAGVSLLVIFGAMIGRLFESSGGAKVLSDRLIKTFGEDRAPLGLGVSSLIFAFPIFFDAGLIVMLPIVFAVARRLKGSLLTYVIPVAGAFAVMHALVPPHPGPVVAGNLLGVDLSLLLLVGLIIALPTWYLGAYLWGLYIGNKIHIPLPDIFAQLLLGEEQQQEKPPCFGLLLSILLLPIFLIFLETGLNSLITYKIIANNQLIEFVRLLGKTQIALLITLIYAILTLKGKHTKSYLEELLDSAIAPVATIIMVTAAGGMFGGVLRASGIGNIVAQQLDDLGLPIVVAAFIVSLGLRVAQGSATVALTTTAALIAPAVALAPDLSSLDLCFIVIAIAGGATALSHVNDSGFWLVSRYLKMDVKTTFKTWTVMESLLGFIAFGFALLGSWLF